MSLPSIGKKHEKEEYINLCSYSKMSLPIEDDRTPVLRNSFFETRRPVTLLLRTV